MTVLTGCFNWTAIVGLMETHRSVMWSSVQTFPLLFLCVCACVCVNDLDVTSCITTNLLSEWVFFLFAKVFIGLSRWEAKWMIDSEMNASGVRFCERFENEPLDGHQLRQNNPCNPRPLNSISCVSSHSATCWKRILKSEFSQNLISSKHFLRVHIDLHQLSF